MGTASNKATHAGADSGSDHVITVTFNSATAGTITLKGITSSSTNFANLNVLILPASGDETCQVVPPPQEPGPDQLQAWFSGGTPTITGDRVFLLSTQNKEGVTICRLLDGSADNSINCPNGTLVHLELPDGYKNAGAKDPYLA